MEWTISKPMLLAIALACRHDDGVRDSLLPVYTGETGETVTTATGDTGTPPVDVWPLCDHVGRTEPITLFGEGRLDGVGMSNDAADIDGDGCAEVAVAAPWEGVYQGGAGAVFLLAVDGLASGIIDVEAAATWEEPGETSWVYRVALVPPQIAWVTAWSERIDGDLTKYKLLAYDLPDAPLADISGAAARAGDLFDPGDYTFATNDIEDCSGLGLPTLCVATSSHGPDHDFAAPSGYMTLRCTTAGPCWTTARASQER